MDDTWADADEVAADDADVATDDAAADDDVDDDDFADLLSTCDGDGSCIAIAGRRHPAAAQRGPWRGFFRDERDARTIARQPCLNLCGAHAPVFLARTDGLCKRCAREKRRDKID